MIERARGQLAEFATDVRDRTGPVSHQALGVAQLLRGHDARPPAVAATRPGGLHALEHALAHEVALHLREGGLDLKKRPARRRGGVHGRVERAEPDAALIEFVNEGDELAGAPPQTVEVEYDQDVALAQVVKAGAEVRALGRSARGVVLEDPLATGLAKRVELAVEDLAPFGGGDAGVPDEAHG